MEMYDMSREVEMMQQKIYMLENELNNKQEEISKFFGTDYFPKPGPPGKPRPAVPKPSGPTPSRPKPGTPKPKPSVPKPSSPIPGAPKPKPPVKTSNFVDFSIVNEHTQQSLTINREFDDTVEIGINESGKDSVQMILDRTKLNELITHLKTL
jgi:hypothetical protein